MPWAQDEPTVDGMTARPDRGRRCLRRRRGVAVRRWPSPASERVLGAIGLHRRGVPDTVEIGYWIRTDCHRTGATPPRPPGPSPPPPSPYLSDVDGGRDPDGRANCGVPPFRRGSASVSTGTSTLAIDAPGQCGPDGQVWRSMDRGGLATRLPTSFAIRATQAGSSACHHGTGRSPPIGLDHQFGRARPPWPSARTATSGTRSQQAWIPTWTVST